MSEPADDELAGTPRRRATHGPLIESTMISFGFARLPITWRELLVRTFKEFVADNGLGLAAQLAYYYFFFALFPAILVGIALASFFPPSTSWTGPSRRSRGWYLRT
jgi:hypothetical protein